MKRTGWLILVLIAVGLALAIVVRRRALEEGAAGYLLKPFSDTALLQTLREALGTN